MSFFKPEKPKPPPAPVVPSKKESAEDLKQAAEEDKQRRFKQRGRAATLLTGGQGVQGDDSSGLATKRLLGGG